MAAGWCDQHGKVHDLTGDPITGGSFESQTVYKGTQSQKRKLRQTLLQSQRKTDGKEFSTLIVQTEISCGFWQTVLRSCGS